MKTVNLFLMLAVTLCFVGCEDPELVTRRNEKQVLQTRSDALQQQLDQAKTAITERDNQLEALKAENIEMQTKAMESISMMLKKQADKDTDLKNKLTESQQQIKELRKTVESLKQENEKLSVVIKDMMESVEVAEESAEEQM